MLKLGHDKHFCLKMESKDGPKEGTADVKRCGFYVKRKRRHCRMIPAKGNNFCAEHLCHQQSSNVGVEHNKEIVECSNASVSTILYSSFSFEEAFGLFFQSENNDDLVFICIPFVPRYLSKKEYHVLWTQISKFPCSNY